MKKTTDSKEGTRAQAKAARLTAALTGLLKGTQRNQLTGYAYSLCFNWAQAEELVQEACYRALKAARRYDGGKSAYGLVARIIRNAYFDGRKRMEFRLHADAPEAFDWSLAWDFVADGSPAALDELVRRDEAAGVAVAVARLPKRQRDAVTLCCLNGLDYRDAARRLGVRLNTLKSRLSRGKASLRRALAAAGRGNA